MDIIGSSTLSMAATTKVNSSRMSFRRFCSDTKNTSKSSTADNNNKNSSTGTTTLIKVRNHQCQQRSHGLVNNEMTFFKHIWYLKIKFYFGENIKVLRGILSTEQKTVKKLSQ